LPAARAKGGNDVLADRTEIKVGILFQLPPQHKGPLKMNIKKQSKIKTLERVVGGLGQDMKAMAEFFDGAQGELARSIYIQSITTAAIIKHFKIDNEIKTIISEIEAEFVAAEAKAKEAVLAKQAARAVEAANEGLQTMEMADGQLN